MRILLLWDYYESYLRRFYSLHPIGDLPYYEQYQRILDDFFVWVAYLLPYLEKAGHDAHIIIGNAEPLQRAWARENGAQYDRFTLIQEQIHAYKPDVLWVAGLPHYTGTFLKGIAPSCGLILAWAAYAGCEKLDLRQVSCLLTSSSLFVEQFRRLGKRSELLMPCFDPRILSLLPARQPDIEVSFYGSLHSSLFTRRVDILSYLVRRTPMQVWAECPTIMRRPWPLRSFFMQFRYLPILLRRRGNGSVYGLDMFRLLRRSKMTFNVHVDAAQGQAGNIRIFEATGAGTLLLTEAAPNLSQMFEPNREVVTYSSKEDAVDKIKYLLEHDSEREMIAAAGQQRTLREHNAAKRAEEFLDIVKKCVRG